MAFSYVASSLRKPRNVRLGRIFPVILFDKLRMISPKKGNLITIRLNNPTAGSIKEIFHEVLSFFFITFNLQFTMIITTKFPDYYGALRSKNPVQRLFRNLLQIYLFHKFFNGEWFPVSRIDIL